MAATLTLQPGPNPYHNAIRETVGRWPDLARAGRGEELRAPGLAGPQDRLLPVTESHSLFPCGPVSRGCSAVAAVGPVQPPQLTGASLPFTGMRRTSCFPGDTVIPT